MKCNNHPSTAGTVKTRPFSALVPGAGGSGAKALIGMLLLAGLSQGSQESLTKLTLEELGNIEVTTASKEPVEVWRTPAAVYVITQEDIRRSGATSIPEVLRLVPGVEVARIDSDHWSVGIRGFGSALSRSLLVLIDGRSVYTPLFAGVYWQVQDTLLDDVERIEVIRGPGGTIWGANAVNGVINIITKRAQETRGTLLSLGGGNVDQGIFGFRYGGGNSRGFNYRIYGKAFTRGPEYHSNHRNFDDWHMGQAGFRADWDSNTYNTFTLQGDIYNGDAGESVTLQTLSPPYVTTVEQNAELAGGNLLGRWKHVLNGGSDIQVQAYYDRTNHFEPQFGETRDTFDVDLLHDLPLGERQEFFWGLGARLSPGHFVQIVPTIDFVPHHQTDEIYSGFVQDDILFFHRRLSLTVGSKFEHNNYTGFEVQPSGRLLWRPTQQQTLWAAVTRAVRTPSRVDEDLEYSGLLAPNPLTFFQFSADGKFFSEQLVGYEAGYRTLVTPKLYVDIATFHNDYVHLESVEPGALSFEASPPPPHLVVPFLIRNGLLGTTSGVEVAPNWKPTARWQLKGSYSYLHLDLKRRAGSLDHSTVNQAEGSSPQHEVVIQSLLNLPKKLEFDQTYRYVSALPAQMAGSYGTADAHLDWHPTRSVQFSLVGQNLLQPRHAEFAGDPGPLVLVKRSAYGQITFRWGRESASH
jgi:iron complex outermembrane receptor protein